MEPIEQDQDYGSLGVSARQNNGSQGGGIDMSPTGYGLVDTGTDDIMIGGEMAKAPKKGLLVGLVVGAAGVILVVLAVVFILNNQNNGGLRQLTIREKFNRLINYVVSGEDSVENVKEVSNSSDNYYYQIQDTLEHRQQLYDRVEELMDDFMVSYGKLDNKKAFSADSEKFDKAINNIREVVSFNKSVRVKEFPTMSEIILDLMKEGAQDVEEKYLNYYDDDSLKENQFYGSFLKVYKEYISDQIALIKLYDEAGCLSGNTLLTNCVEHLDNEKLKVSINEKIGSDKLNRMRMAGEYNADAGFIATLMFVNQLVLEGREKDVENV